MNDRSKLPPGADDGRIPDGSTLSPLPGEPGIPDVAERTREAVSKKGPRTVGLLVITLVAASALALQQFTPGTKKPDDGEAKLASDRPTAATAEPRRLDLPARRSSEAPAASPRIPALVPTADESTEPIGVRRTGQSNSGTGNAKAIAPEDAPVLVVSTRPTNTGVANASVSSRREGMPDTAAHSQEPIPDDPLAATTRNLQDYQRQLQALLDDLNQRAAQTNGQAPGPNSLGAPLLPVRPGAAQVGSPLAGNGLFGGQLQSSATPRASASMLRNRSLTLPKGAAFTCALKTRIISAASGLVGCQVQRNVYGDDGRVLLIERGSHMDGEYRITSVRPGTTRIPVLWTRVRTPMGVTVDIESPGTGQLGESGVDGHVDNRWGERIGAAMLLSLIDDSVKLVIQNQSNDSQASTVVMPSTTANTSKLAEKVLDSTINIPPLVYQNLGGIVGIYVARDVDFSSVYELKAVSR